MHRDEARKPTNTGRLAALCLPNSEIVLRGDEAGASSWSLDAAYRPVVLFPSDDAVPLATLAAGDPRPVLLVVPDGTWRQAAKVRKRAPQLEGVPCASLPDGAATRYRLRAERRPGGLATAEAIARAYAVLEGDLVADALLTAFDAMVEATLRVRGRM
jgi:DTW domain-containing protein YfiP